MIFAKKTILILKKKQIIFEETSKNNWNYYPSYNDYENIMQAFADSFPDICKLHNIGTLSSGRKILIAQILQKILTISLCLKNIAVVEQVTKRTKRRIKGKGWSSKLQIV